MSQLLSHVEDYLALRRSLGFKLAKEGRLLPGFSPPSPKPVGRARSPAGLALGWALLPAGVSPVWAAQRLTMIRGFARYLRTVDPAAQLPPADLLPGRIRRVSPHIYSDAGIGALLTAARKLRNPLKAATLETLIGLLAVSGLRGSEAMRLDRGDIDSAGLPTVRATKFRNYAEGAVMPSPVTVGVVCSNSAQDCSA